MDYYLSCGNNILLLTNNNKLLERRERARMELEKKLAKTIEEKGISVRSIATRTGIDEQILYRCLRAEQRLKADEFLAICKVIEVEPRNYVNE